MEPRDKLKKDLKEGSVAHAYLFYGPKGTGRGKTAEWFALNIATAEDAEENRSAENKSATAETQNTPETGGSRPAPTVGAHPGVRPPSDVAAPREAPAFKFDVLKVAPDEMGKIGIDQVRSVRSFLSLSPGYGSKKGVIISKAEQMTTEAANAFLKTLEEPQDERFIILVAQNPRRLPPTITSRCVQIKFSSSAGKKGVLKSGFFKKVVQGSLNTRFQIAEKLSKREQAEVKEFLNNLILYLRQVNLFSNAQLVKKASETKGLLEQTNVKPRLALEHLLIEADRRGHLTPDN